jgi:FkbM family methyltransferase
LLELLPSNRQLLRWLINFTRLSDVAFVHDYAISNATYLAPEPAGVAGNEMVSLKDADRMRARWGQNKSTIQVLTLDEFMLRQRLDEVWAVVIDAEGYDALVLEGMRRVLAAHRVVFVEFEYHSIGYWGSAVPLSERRSLKATQQWLGALGYTCFLEADTVAPISGPCWMDAFETRRMSNVVCTHRAELLYNMSEQGYIERLSRRAPVRPGATLKD